MLLVLDEGATEGGDMTDGATAGGLTVGGGVLRITTDTALL